MGDTIAKADFDAHVLIPAQVLGKRAEGLLNPACILSAVESWNLSHVVTSSPVRELTIALDRGHSHGQLEEDLVGLASVIVDHVLEQFGNLVNRDRAILERCRVPPIPFNFRSR